MESYYLKWQSHVPTMLSEMKKMLVTQRFIDVTIVSEGKKMNAHRLVLSACSDYLQKILAENPCSHPIILMNGRPKIIQTIIDFMYNGEVIIPQADLAELYRMSRVLQIKGLSFICQQQLNSADVPVFNQSEWITDGQDDNVPTNVCKSHFNPPDSSQVQITNLEGSITKTTAATDINNPNRISVPMVDLDEANLTNRSSDIKQQVASLNDTTPFNKAASTFKPFSQAASTVKSLNQAALLDEVSLTSPVLLPNKSPVPPFRKSEAAPLTSAASSIISSAPPSNSAEPPSNSEAPLSNSEAPLSNSEAPLSNSEAPLSNSEAPLSNSEAPLNNSEAPHQIACLNQATFLNNSVDLSSSPIIIEKSSVETQTHEIPNTTRPRWEVVEPDFPHSNDTILRFASGDEPSSSKAQSYSSNVSAPSDCIGQDEGERSSPKLKLQIKPLQIVELNLDKLVDLKRKIADLSAHKEKKKVRKIPAEEILPSALESTARLKLHTQASKAWHYFSWKDGWFAYCDICKHRVYYRRRHMLEKHLEKLHPTLNWKKFQTVQEYLATNPQIPPPQIIPLPQNKSTSSQSKGSPDTSQPMDTDTNQVHRPETEQIGAEDEVIVLENAESSSRSILTLENPQVSCGTLGPQIIQLFNPFPITLAPANFNSQPVITNFNFQEVIHSNRDSYS